jgi:hypothetical protein
MANAEENKDRYEELFLIALGQLEQGEPPDMIELLLLQKCEDAILIAVVLKEARNVHYAVLRKQGFRLILLGCILGVTGFLITLFNFNTSRSIDFAMYGLTTMGMLIVFWGLFKIIG